MRRVHRWFGLLALVAALLPHTAAAHPAALSAGAVVALKGTPHIWVADSSSVLHWGGDTRAIAGKTINWGDRTEVTAEQLRAFQIGDPWLSAGLVKIGDPIYFAKWEASDPVPTLLHIQSIADVELFGINGSNYGAMVLDQAAWEQKYAFRAGALTKGVLAAATQGATTAQAAPTAAPAAAPARPNTPQLVVPTQALLGARGISDGSGWIVGEVRNDGGADACGYTVSATLTDSGGAIVAAERQDYYWRTPAGASYPFELSLRSVPTYKNMEVRATPKDSCFYAPLSAAVTNVREDKQELLGRVISQRFHALGTVKNDGTRAVKSLRVIVEFLDGSNNICDVMEYGQANVDQLAPGQSTVFDVESTLASLNARVTSIKSARAFAFASN